MESSKVLSWEHYIKGAILNNLCCWACDCCLPRWKNKLKKTHFWLILNPTLAPLCCHPAAIVAFLTGLLPLITTPLHTIFWPPTYVKSEIHLFQFPVFQSNLISSVEWRLWHHFCLFCMVASRFISSAVFNISSSFIANSFFHPINCFLYQCFLPKCSVTMCEFPQKW